MTKIVLAALAALVLSFGAIGCSALDAHECKTGDIDRDGDGRCNE